MNQHSSGKAALWRFSGRVIRNPITLILIYSCLVDAGLSFELANMLLTGRLRDGGICAILLAVASPLMAEEFGMRERQCPTGKPPDRLKLSDWHAQRRRPGVRGC
jgi:hypothetical protein